MNYFRRALRFTSSELCVQIHALSYSLDVKLLPKPYGPCAPTVILSAMPKKFNSPLHEALKCGALIVFSLFIRSPKEIFWIIVRWRNLGGPPEATTVVILRVTQDPALRCVARDGVILDTRLAVTKL